MTINYSRFLQYSVLCIALAGCQSLPGDKGTPSTYSAQQLEQLLKDSHSSNKSVATNAALEAALMVSSDQPELARKLIAPLQANGLSNRQRAQYQLVSNELLFNSGDFNKVISNSNSSSAKRLQTYLNAEQQHRNTVVTANSYAKQGKHLTAAKLRITLSEQLSNTTAIKENNDAIWESLIRVPSPQLQALPKDRSELAGWVALIDATQHDDEQQTMLQQWKNGWPRHSANKALPSNLGPTRPVEILQPKHIALLVPLSGKLEKAGESLRDGFLAAYYKEKNDDTTVTIYDSQSADIKSIYDHAVADGADLVVGPLAKSKVSDLARNNISTPVLSLNYSNNQPVSDNFYQLSMSINDEIALITNHAKSLGIKRALLFYPKNSWGSHIADEYSRQWQQLGGVIASKAVYTDERSMAPSLKNALRVANNKRRQDLDAVFVVAKNKAGRSVRPLLAFYYANDLPVFATSQIYTGTPNPGADADLNGVMFSELPWVIKSSPLRTQINNYINAGGNYSKSLYALGIDAYTTVPRLNQLKERPETRIYGTTGVLRMSDKGKIIRQPSWGIFKNGYAKPLTTN